MHHIVELISTLKLRIILWMHDIEQPMVVNINGLCCRLQYFCCIGNSVTNGSCRSEHTFHHQNLPFHKSNNDVRFDVMCGDKLEMMYMDLRD